jgi:hypothetical protein
LEYFQRISTQRPSLYIDSDDTDFDFVKEEMMATKLTFPSSKLNEIKGLDHLVVWISDPKVDDLSIEPYTFTGTFLYLIETLTDRKQYRSTVSGCSALQLISNICDGKPLFQVDWSEPLGRNSSKHPIEKLRDIGAFVIGKQRITTVYRKRYMTNEQCFEYKNEKYRCNDLLGYPLFIDF